MLLVFFFKCVHFVISSIYAKAGKNDQNYSSDTKVTDPCIWQGHRHNLENCFVTLSKELCHALVTAILRRLSRFCRCNCITALPGKLCRDFVKCVTTL